MHVGASQNFSASAMGLDCRKVACRLRGAASENVRAALPILLCRYFHVDHLGRRRIALLDLIADLTGGIYEYRHCAASKDRSAHLQKVATEGSDPT
jgi:hypothetical protein